MTKAYRLGWANRLANRFYRWLTLAGLGAAHRHVLTVRGRRSGEPRSTPVDVMEVDGREWLVAPYGETQWVRNARVHPEVTLRRGRRTEHRLARERTGAAEALPVIRAYVERVPVTRAYWEIDEDSSDADVAAAARAHPVFELLELPDDPPAGG